MRNNRFFTSLIIILSGVLSVSCQCSVNSNGDEEKTSSSNIILEEDFSSPLSPEHWQVEMEGHGYGQSSVSVLEDQLVMDTKAGVTVWLKQKLQGNLQITYKRQVVMEGGINDRLSDLNQFWMASDPRNADLFTRQGKFDEYDSLQMYYIGFGGNYNKTTRFRKYQGTGEKTLLFDLEDKEHLLAPNHWYTITIRVKDGLITFQVDGETFFSYQDEQVLKEGYFGFRSTWSRHRIDDLQIVKLD
ncbi:hypothetical protein GCM10007049_29800 [Echinicola pacifica]|uniref:DUF6250 domain-containing protein n=1 Tax=Echinicola pacifica TaxID=346377 RepID=A0A918UUQ0_9BACT|nr:DUF6250 domain-containing protein [Echinicola pacifica]GGZ34462.1 hypothetical protein GCM10007049_29800 [Echinicola pacifica]